MLPVAAKVALVAVPALAILGLMAVSGTSTAAPKPPAKGGNAPPGYVPYVRFACPSCPGGFAYGLDPALVQAVYNALPNWTRTAQTPGPGVLRWELAPKGPQQPANQSIGQDIELAKASGYSVLVDPGLAWPQAGQRHVTIVAEGVDPWALSSPDSVVLFGAGPFANPPGQAVQPGAPVPAGDALATLPTSLRNTVQHLGDQGPIRTQLATADDLENEGYLPAAQWLRNRAKDRTLTRKADARSKGYYPYLLRPGELPPYSFAEHYVSDGKRYHEIVRQTPGLSEDAKGVKGWNYGTTVRIPASWPDPETIPVLPLGAMGGGKAAQQQQPQAAPPPAAPGQVASVPQGGGTVPAVVVVPASGGMGPNDRPAGEIGDWPLGPPPPKPPPIGPGGDLDPRNLPGERPEWPWQDPNVHPVLAGNLPELPDLGDAPEGEEVPDLSGLGGFMTAQEEDES